MIISVLVMMFYYTNNFAFGLERSDIQKIENEIKSNNDKIIQYDKDVIKKNKTINEKTNEIEEKKTKLRELKSLQNESWDSLLKVEQAQKELDNSIKDKSRLRGELLEILSSKSDSIKIIKELEKQLDDDTLRLKNQNKLEQSKLVKKLGIVNSKICITMVKNNLNSTCPTYKDLIILDNSITSISGKFTTDKDGYFHRKAPPVSNSYRMYDFDTTPRIFIDPPREMISRIKIIELQPNFDTYFDSKQMQLFQEFEIIDVEVNGTYSQKVKTIQVKNQTQDFGRVIYHDLFIDPSCRKAVVNTDVLYDLLVKVINYMRNNCDDDFALFDVKEIIPINATYQDITTSQKYKDDQRLEYIKKNCIFQYGVCKT